MEKYGPLIWFLLIGLAAGWLASIIMKRSDMGLVRNMIVGVVGAILGGTITRFLELDLAAIFGSEKLGEVVTSFAGALVFLILINLFKTPDKKK
jgi:uncharacterized membrane protein YeaQ/YmgE (transglycosylase-associated protein family)